MYHFLMIWCINLSNINSKRVNTVFKVILFSSDSLFHPNLSFFVLFFHWNKIEDHSHFSCYTVFRDKYYEPNFYSENETTYRNLSFIVTGLNKIFIQTFPSQKSISDSYFLSTLAKVRPLTVFLFFFL